MSSLINLSTSSKPASQGKRRFALASVSLLALTVSAFTPMGSNEASAKVAKKVSKKTKTKVTIKVTKTTVKASSTPVVISNDGVNVTFSVKPTKIISLSPSATEDLFAIGAGSQVVAVDDQSNFPANAPKTKLSGFTPNVEAILAYKPDLVVVSQKSDVVDKLRAAKVNVLIETAPLNVNGIYAQIDELGLATGQVSGATAVNSKIKSSIMTSLTKADALSKVKKPTVTYYHELDNTLYSVTSKTFIGGVYSLFSLTNIADAADKTATGYPQLTSEYVVSQNPDLIFLADSNCCAVTAASLAQRPGWADLGAIKRGGVVVLNDDVASRWGPRIVELFDAVSTAVVRHESLVSAK